MSRGFLRCLGFPTLTPPTIKMTNDNADSADRSGQEGILGRIRSLFGESEGADAAEPSSDADDLAGEQEDAFTSARRAMIERVIAFDEKRVFDVMAPRADIFAVDIDTPLDELVRTFADAGHSRMPIYRGDLDDPVGMVHIKDVVGLLSNGATKRDGDEPVLKSLKRDLLYAPPSMRVTDMLLRMQASRIHMALVIDEYGGTDGLVTIEDLVEEIVGDINDEHDDDDEPSITPAPDGGWIADARAELDVFEAETGAQLNLEDDEVDTVGGYVVSIAGRVPQRGEIISSPSGFDIEIAEADARKVRRLRIRPSGRVANEAAE